jgi:hypothetical protein
VVGGLRGACTVPGTFVVLQSCSCVGTLVVFVFVVLRVTCYVVHIHVHCY